MNIKKGLKTVGYFVKDFLEVVSPVVVTGLLLSKSSSYQPIYSYGDAVAAIMNSSMWSEDKNEAVSALPLYSTPGFYKAIITVANSSMWSEDKLEAILEMCKKA